MATTQMQIDNLLTALKALLEQIQPLRQRVAEVDQIQREYYQRMSKLDAEADRLNRLKISLMDRLAGIKPPLRETEPTPAESQPTLPEEVINITPKLGTPPPPPPTESPAGKRWRTNTTD